MHIYHHSHVQFSILVLISSCPYGKNGRFVDTNLQQSKDLVPCESARNSWKSLHMQQLVESCAGSICSEDLPHFLLLFWRVPDRIRHDFQGRYLANLHVWIFKRQINCTSPALSVSVAVPIGYQIWVLKAISAVEQKGSGLWDYANSF